VTNASGSSPNKGFLSTPYKVRNPAEGLEILEAEDTATFETYVESFFVKEYEQIEIIPTPIGLPAPQYSLAFRTSYYLTTIVNYDDHINRSLDRFRPAGGPAVGTARIGLASAPLPTAGSGLGSTLDGLWLEQDFVPNLGIGGGGAEPPFPMPVVPTLSGTTMSRGYPQVPGGSPSGGAGGFFLFAGRQATSILLASFEGSSSQDAVILAGASLNRTMPYNGYLAAWVSWKTRAL
jgi:hypothetical protein